MRSPYVLSSPRNARARSAKSLSKKSLLPPPPLFGKGGGDAFQIRQGFIIDFPSLVALKKQS